MLIKEENHSKRLPSPEFYQRLTAATERALPPTFVKACIEQLPRAVATAGRKLSKQQLRDADRLEKADNANQDLTDLLDE